MYVNNLLVLSPLEAVIKAFKTMLLRHFDIIDKGPAIEFLGIQILRGPNGKIHLS